MSTFPSAEQPQEIKLYISIKWPLHRAETVPPSSLREGEGEDYKVDEQGFTIPCPCPPAFGTYCRAGISLFLPTEYPHLFPNSTVSVCSVACSEISLPKGLGIVYDRKCSLKVWKGSKKQRKVTQKHPIFL